MSDQKENEEPEFCSACGDHCGSEALTYNFMEDIWLCPVCQEEHDWEDEDG